MTNYTITRNAEFNSFEILFEEKPDEQTRETLKSAGYRWHKLRGIWYGYKDITDKLGNVQAETAPATAPKKSASLWERTRIDTIPEHSRTLDAVTVAAELRAELRRRFPEMKFSIRSQSYSGGQSVNCYIVKSPYGQTIIKGDPSAYDWRDREDREKDSPALAAVRAYCVALADSYNYDNSDPMTDYYDVNFYGGYFQNASDVEFTEPTPEQADDIADFERQQEADEKRKTEELRARLEEEQRQAEIARVEYEKREAEAQKIVEQIYAEIVWRDGENVAITNLNGGAGKEANRAELDETLKRKSTTGYTHENDAIITRKITFTNPEYFAFFENNFMRDWSFCAGMGGSNTDDPRVPDMKTYGKLTAEQRETVKWYIDNGIAVYLGDELKYIIDPQGYDYARYVYIPTEQSETMSADEYHARATSEQLPAFYIPAPLSEQIEKAEVKPGEQITIVSMGDLGNVTDTRAEFVGIEPCRYAQYTDAARLYIKQPGKRGIYQTYIKPSNETIIYRGWLNIPDELKKEQISDYTYINRTAGTEAKQYLKDVIKHFAGREILIDTIAR